MNELIAAARALVARLPKPEHKSYPAYHSRQELDALRKALDEVGDGVCREPGLTLARVDGGNGEVIAVTITDDEHRIRRVLWERP